MNNRNMLMQAASLGLVMGLLYGMSSEVAARQYGSGYVRGEAERLMRHAYDYRYRNSNHNIFRSSRHASPLGNIFRSSRHYQQRLAASYDGYPVSTTIRYDRSVTRGRGKPGRGKAGQGKAGKGHARKNRRGKGKNRSVTISYAYPRRYPQGPTGFYSDLRPVYQVDPYLIQPGGGYGYSPPVPVWERNPPPILRAKEAPRSPEAIEMVALNVQAVDRKATQRVIVQTIINPDGTISKIITSVPIEDSTSPGDRLEQAWKRLAVGEYDLAARDFQDLSLDEDDGAMAMGGYGLVKILQGEFESAENVLQRAILIDDSIIAKLKPDKATRIVLSRQLDLSGQDNSLDQSDSVRARLASILDTLLVHND
ncbi:MAG: hypothetical protein O7G85_03090 [Planctomycetota bacterium]|nr:hypothetical protein [Planctomycetota bacterium]